MDQAQLNGITSFIWNIADDVLRDVFVRGKYRDVILPMTVLLRLDAVLEPNKQAVLEMRSALDKAGITNQDDALRSASGEAFYNTSPFLLRDLKSRKTRQTLKDDFMAYLDGFSPNVQDILKNFELAAEDIQRICDTFLAFEETPQSKISPNAAFGYWKVKVERPLRLHSQLTRPRIEALRYASGDEELRAAFYAELGDALVENWAATLPALKKLLSDWSDKSDESDSLDEDSAPRKGLPDSKRKKLLSEATWRRDAALLATATKLRKALGDGLYEDHNDFLEKVEAALKKLDIKPSAADLKLITAAVSWRDESAVPVIAKLLKDAPDELRGRFPLSTVGRSQIKNQKSKIQSVSFEPDSELRDFEQIPLLEPGGIAAFIRREVLPYTPDAWLVEADTKIAYEVSFTRHFYQPPQLRTLAEISADILALEQETEGLLHEITKGATA